jgi:hypothetical protein
MSRARLLGALLLASGLWACAEDFAAPSEVTSLRVLAVAPEPASGIPGETVELTMLIHDGRVGQDDVPAPAPAEVLWIGGCHNPPSRQYFGCYPAIQAVAAELAEGGGEGLEPIPGLVGVGTEFSFDVPADILESAPREETDPVHFGVSYVFFAACAGQLRLEPDVVDRLPLGCYDQTGKRLGAADYVEGFATVYSYEGMQNHNPIIEGVTFEGGEVDLGACESDSECAEHAADQEAWKEYACSEAGRCVPVVPRCAPEADACREYSIDPLVSRESAEPDPGGRDPDGNVPNEILWANFYADAGQFSTDTRLINDRETGWIDPHANRWLAQRKAPGSVRLFTTVHDNRSGAAWLAFEVLVRDP